MPCVGRARRIRIRKSGPWEYGDSMHLCNVDVMVERAPVAPGVWASDPTAEAAALDDDLQQHVSAMFMHFTNSNQNHWFCLSVATVYKTNEIINILMFPRALGCQGLVRRWRFEACFID